VPYGRLKKSASNGKMRQTNDARVQQGNVRDFSGIRGVNDTSASLLVR
jgi:hypothetical protein